MTQHIHSFKYIYILAIIALLGGGSLFKSLTMAEASEEEISSKPPAMPVEMVVIEPQMIQIWRNFSGHVKAVNHAEIRPQVSGRITDIRFKDGEHVNKGDILIVIDPRPYKASLKTAKAALEAAKTQAELTEKEYKRAEQLIGNETISQSILDKRTNNRQLAIAAVQGAEALVESAKIDLDYAYIKAPISGKISRAEITEGNLVQTGSNAPLLTMIIADDTVYADFEVDEGTYLKVIKSKSTSDTTQIPVRLKLLSADLKYKGFIHSFDNQIDPDSGTIRARAIFDNEDHALLPGMSVSILMGSAEDSKNILVPSRAIGTDQDRKFVYVIDENNTVQYREVSVGEVINGNRIILSGLTSGETIITEGLAKIRPGMAVSDKKDTPKTAPKIEEEKE